MADTNLEAILEALAVAVEGITPSVLPSVVYQRWRGPGWLDESPKPAPRSRQFQFQLRSFTTPRTLSGASAANQWVRCELRLVVAYDFKQTRAHDALGLGPSWEVGHDAADLWATLVLGNPVSASAYHLKRLVPLSPWDRGRTGQCVIYGWDFEFARG